MPELSADLYGTISHKLDALKPSGIRAFDKEVSQIPGIIKLTVGEPDFNTPEHVKQAAIKSIQNDDSHYAPQAGKPELLAAISDYIKQTRQVEYDPASEVVVTVGATEALDATLFSLLNTGDKVIVPTPAFALYFPLIAMTGATAVQVDTAADGFVLTPERLEEDLAQEGPGVKAVLLNYPSNPTCREYPADVLAGLAKVITAHHLYAIADEIYSELVYGGPCVDCQHNSRTYPADFRLVQVPRDDRLPPGLHCRTSKNHEEHFENALLPGDHRYGQHPGCGH